MKLKLLFCEIFCREACLLVANSPHTCDVEFLPKGLHDLGVDKMLPRLQERIDATDESQFDAILLGYGLCNNGIVGLCSKRSRLVIPRAHDCITLFLGDRHTYQATHAAHPGTYFMTTGWLERDDPSKAGDVTVQQKLGLFLQYEELVEKYGEDNARYIAETMGNATVNYDRMLYINMGLECDAHFCALARQRALQKGWDFEETQGSMELLRKFIYGEWDDDFLVLEPGQSVAPSYDTRVINLQPCCGADAAGPTPLTDGRYCPARADDESDPRRG